MQVDPDRMDHAVREVREGGTVVYPTETVYGLGADATDPAAVELVFERKGRDRSKPVSLGVPDVESALEYVDPDDRTEQFMRRFLPGPVTVVCPRREGVPDALTAGRDRVGIRVPDHPAALELLDRAGPLTATSANRSGAGSARRPEEVAGAIRDASVVLDAGETPGGESTVVDPGAGEVIRPGRLADEVRAWLPEE